MVNERFFILTPTTKGEIIQEGMNAPATVYYDEAGKRLRWTSINPLPNIGDTVNIIMNGIGIAEVKGYFVSETDYSNYLGIMAKPLKPPKWLVNQNKRQAKDKTRQRPAWMTEGIGCFFGIEVEPL